VEDLGLPIAYTVLPEGIPVYDRHGNRIGVVDEVLADFRDDVFDGLIVHTVPLPGRHLFAAAEQIESLYERGAVLGVEEGDLQEREEDSKRRREKDERAERPLAAWLARLWDRITGRR
jgi:uncharacterized protein YrrD